MNWKRAIPVLIVLLISLYVTKRDARRTGVNDRGDTVEYQGEVIRLRKAYQTWEAYKEDADNLDANEIPKIESLLINAKVAASFKSREEMVKAMLQLKFPGYGAGFSGEVKQTDGSTLDLVQIEVPMREKSRFLVFRTDQNGTIHFVDNIVTNWISNALVEQVRVRLSDSNLVYVRGTDVLRQTSISGGDFIP